MWLCGGGAVRYLIPKWLFLINVGNGFHCLRSFFFFLFHASALMLGALMLGALMLGALKLGAVMLGALMLATSLQKVEPYTHACRLNELDVLLEQHLHKFKQRAPAQAPAPYLMWGAVSLPAFFYRMPHLAIPMAPPELQLELDRTLPSVEDSPAGDFSSAIILTSP